jgi:hypothetical protein
VLDRLLTDARAEVRAPFWLPGEADIGKAALLTQCRASLPPTFPPTSEKENSRT